MFFSCFTTFRPNINNPSFRFKPIFDLWERFNHIPLSLSSELFSYLTTKINRLYVYMDSCCMSCSFIVIEIIYCCVIQKKSETIYHRRPRKNAYSLHSIVICDNQRLLSFHHRQFHLTISLQFHSILSALFRWLPLPTIPFLHAHTIYHP